VTSVAAPSVTIQSEAVTELAARKTSATIAWVSSPVWTLRGET
jgi:hypothetical protein